MVFLAFLGFRIYTANPNKHTVDIDQTPLLLAYCDTSKAKIGPRGLGTSWVVWLRDLK